MDPRSPSFNGGGGLHPRRPSQDDGSLRPLQARDGVPDTWFSPATLTLEQLRITGNHNEYTEGPASAQHRRKGDSVTTPVSQRERLSNDQMHLGATRTSVARQIISNQPKPAALTSSKKNVNEDPRGGVHSECARCGLCRCPECRRPRALPSCWMCGGRCVCSAQHAAEYCTCVCCLKGLFYHCSSDDEDTCADKPFSCAQSHCCVRWTAVSLMTAALPCLLCHLPARGCVAVCQGCYDRATRPGCRCKNALPCETACKPT
ncbi:protein sprouty homolog 2 [Entelurus aequoreus]|uniref:protein sprouty homolog 2 n=1 Tax=Entelurus aequoreus TaxID=161455 RepID=UPI002B1E7BC7|nr:protein sprouty homolog 2 [Entelurus aequoreus]